MLSLAAQSLASAALGYSTELRRIWPKERARIRARRYNASAVNTMQLPPARRPLNFLARLRPDRVALLLAALAILGAWLILASQVNYGVGVATDSLAYASAAEAIAAGNNPTLPNSPPLFPVAMAVAILLGLEPVNAMAHLNAAAFGMTVFFSTLWLWRKTRSLFLVIWASVALIIAPPLTLVTPWALSEPLFILLTMSALLTLDAFTENRRRSLLLLAAVLAALAFLTRYLGAAMIGAGAILLLYQSNVSFTQRAKDAAVYAGVASIPTCAWLLRNFLQMGSPTRHSAYPPFGSLSQNIEAAAVELGRTLFAWSDLFSAVSRRVSLYAGDALVPMVVGAAALAAAAFLVGAARLPAADAGPRSRSVAPAFTMALFVGAYITTAVIGVTTTSRSEGFGIRYFAPAYPPILLAVALIANACFRKAAWKRNVFGLTVALSSAFGAALLLLWLLPQFGLYAEERRRRLEGPLGHDVAAWRNSPSVSDLRAKALAGRAVVGTNTLDVAPYLVGARDGFVLLPCMTTDAARDWLSDAGERNEEAYVVWFDGFAAPIDCETAPSAIRSIAQVETVARLPNGNVFRVFLSSADPLDPHRATYASFASLPPVISSDFDIHLSGKALVYLRDDCGPADTQDAFFLHIVPVDENNLPYERRRYGFDNLGFSFDAHGAHFDGKCLTTAILPDYPIARVRTGQFVRGGSKVWEEEFRLPP